MLRRRGCYGVVGVFQTKKSERKREDTEVLVKGKVIRYGRYQDCGKCIPAIITISSNAVTEASNSIQ